MSTDNTNVQTNADASHKADSGGVIVVASVIFFFSAMAFLFFLRIYIRSRSTGRALGRPNPHPPAPRPDVPQPRGLDLAVLRCLPVRLYNRQDFKEEVECAVCLSELADGEKARLLPGCRHGFHLGCIDTWFQSHSTCPVCRAAVEAKTPHASSSPSSSSLAIGVEEEDGAGVPVADALSCGAITTTVRSLRRLLSRGRKAADIEQGSAAAAPSD